MYRYFIYCRKSTEADDHQAISLESQQWELTSFAKQHSLQVVQVLFESRSARTPGRPVFTQLLQRIGKGEANGIIAWHPDRLARNAVDGGQIIHYFDTGRLLDLRFPTFTFENSPQGKFMLMIMFGHSKYEVDTLSEHVKRGNRMKRELGWLPGPAPIGYLNIRSDSGARVIGRDPERFPIIKKIWELFLTGNYSGLDLLAVASSQFRLRIKRTWRAGGGKLGKSVLYRMLRNPFYTGNIVFQSQWFPGSHEPMITVAEFNRAQKLLRGIRARPRRYRFAYSGLMRCGNCGATITAERRTKPSGKEYVYYHCTHGKIGRICRQRAIEERELEHQITAFFLEHGAKSESLFHRAGLRYLLATKVASITLQEKKIHLELKKVA